MTNEELIIALNDHRDVHEDAAERIQELQAKIDRLEARGITELQHECAGRHTETFELGTALQRCMELYQDLMGDAFDWEILRDELGIVDCEGCGGWKVPSQYDECVGPALDLNTVILGVIQDFMEEFDA